MNLISRSPSGLFLSLILLPLSFIISLANSNILSGSPISNKNTSPPLLSDPAWITSSVASFIVIKYRITLESVTVTGPPDSICFLNKGTTLPDVSSTLPNLTMQYLVLH